MSDGGAFSAMGSLIGAGINQQTAEGWQNLTREQQQFLMNQLSKIEGIQAPKFNTDLPAPTQLALQNYSNPTLAQGTQISIDPQDRANQIAALNKLQSVAGGAADSELNAANYRAMQNAAQQRQGATQGIMANMASRGTLGSGQELAARMQAAQNGAGSAQSGMLQAAADNNQAKLGALGQYLQGQSALRGQDTSQSLENANIANQFNMYNTGLKNQVSQANTGLANQQSMYNTGQNNAYQQALLQLQNQAAQQTFQDTLGQAQAGAGEANTISGNAMSAGATQGALSANTAAGIAQGLGNFGNSLSSLGSGAQNNENDYKNVDVEQAPKAQNDEEGTTFNGSSWY